MRYPMLRRCVAVLAVSAAVLCAAEGPAGAQYFVRYAGDGASRRIRDGLTVVTQAEQALDTGHRTLAGWLFWAAEGALQDAADALPDADAIGYVGAARYWLEKNNAVGAARAFTRASDECRRLSSVWDLGEVEPKCAALLALAEEGDCPAALAALGPLSVQVRIGPVRALLEQAGKRIAAARDAAGKGRSFEALKCAAEAKEKLRRAFLGARLTRARVLVSRARGLAARRARLRAGWTLGRASGVLARTGTFADTGGADAAVKIRADIDAAGQALCGDENVWMPLMEIEAKIDALIAKCCVP